MNAQEFIAKWRASELKESSAAQEHFIDLCRLLGEPTPAQDDPSGQRYSFERGARKDTGGRGWADVWKRHCFAWEYKGKHKDLDAAFNQLRQYALALENPPLLIVSDMARFRIYTNWTNSVSVRHEFALEDLADAAVRDKLKWAMSDPERLRPGESRQALTERAATAFAALAQALRARGHDPQQVAHFVNRLVFCMFAEDVGLLPNEMFTRMLRLARRQPEEFEDMARELFGKMATGGRVGYETVAWFNGGLFDSDDALALTRAEIETTLEAAALDWSEIDPSILGTLFERGLDPAKRSQLGAHYTDRDKIMQIIEPVVTRPWLKEWEKARAEISLRLERADVAASIAAARASAARPSAPCATSSKSCAPSPSSIPPAAPATSSTSRCTPSRTWSTASNSKPSRWACSAPSPPSAPPTSKESRSTPTPPNWPASPSGSAKSSGCAATASAAPATPSSTPSTPSNAATPSSTPTAANPTGRPPMS